METASSPVELCQQNNVPATLPLTAPAPSLSTLSTAACGTLYASTPFTASAPTYRPLSTAAPFTMAAMSRCLRSAGGSECNRHQSAQQHLEDPATRPTR